MKSSEYQSLEKVLAQKHPLSRLQQFKEREIKEQADSQLLQQSTPEKASIVTEKIRTGSNVKSTSKLIWNFEKK